MKIQYLKGENKGKIIERDPERAKNLIKAKVAIEVKEEKKLTETKELKTKVETKKKK